MQLYNYKRSSTSSDDEGPLGIFIGGAFISVLVIMAGVGLQIGIETLFGAFFGGLSNALVGTVVPTIITAAFEGAASATLAYLIFGGWALDQSRDVRLRGFVAAALTGAAIGLAFSGLVEGNRSGQGSGGGDPASDFLPMIVVFGILILLCALVGSVIFAILNRGLMFLGLRVASELTEDAGERLAEAFAPKFIKQKWWPGSNAKEDESLALTKGLAKGTEWLINCKRTDSDAIVRGFIVGTFSGAATFQLESFARRPNYGFFWQVFVELFGSFVGLGGGLLILAFVVAVFRYPLRLLLDIVGLVIIAGVILLVFKACAR